MPALAERVKSNPPTLMGYKLNEEASTRKVLRMAWTTPETNNTFRDISNMKKNQTACGSDYARFRRERAMLRNYSDSAN